MENQEFFEGIKDDVQDWCFVHGLLMTRSEKVENKERTVAIPAPITLHPTVWPKVLMQRVIDLAPLFNDLMHNVSRDSEWLLESLKNVPDPFTQKRLEVLKKVSQEGFRQKIYLGLYRSDYMLNKQDEKLGVTQVEINSISASFSNLSNLTTHLHGFLAARYPECPLFSKSGFSNVSLESFPAGLAQAKKLYKDNKKPESVIMMVVHPNESNRVDQRWLDMTLWEKFGIRMIRCSLAEIAQTARLDSDGALITRSGWEVAVAYYRAGYGPDDYPSETEWQGRLLIERSLAIKCPTIGLDLAGCKKVQQLLAKPSILKRYVSDPEAMQKLQLVFTGLHSLDVSEDPEAVKNIILEASKNPHAYVMKPQREGGGNNVYGEKIPPKLKELEQSNDLSSWIIMNRIFPPSTQKWFFRHNTIFCVESVSELGIYSVAIGDLTTPSLSVSKYAGYLLRTKAISENEGGVAAGASALDSLILE